jgi:hypothetical protein
MMAGKFKKDGIKAGIKRPGALTAVVGGKPSENKAAVRNLAKNGTALQKKEANYFLNVLGGKKKKRRD